MKRKSLESIGIKRLGWLSYHCFLQKVRQKTEPRTKQISAEGMRKQKHYTKAKGNYWERKFCEIKAFKYNPICIQIQKHTFYFREKLKFQSICMYSSRWYKTKMADLEGGSDQDLFGRKLYLKSCGFLGDHHDGSPQPVALSALQGRGPRSNTKCIVMTRSINSHIT